ncbi:MAG: peptidase MA family metallohydrolase [Longimicrobiales bacterium]
MTASGRRAAWAAVIVAVLSCIAGGTASSARPQAVVSGNVVVHHGPGGEPLARALITPPGVLAPLPGLPDTLLERPPPIHVHLAATPAEFDSLTGGRTPEWGAGVAFPDAGTIVLPGYGSDRGPTGELPRVLRHELAHVALHRYLGTAQVPRWFSEGYATWAAGQLDTDAAWLLRIAFITRRAPPIDSIALDWPVGEVDARIAYLLSASVLDYLHAQGGERALRIFLERWRDSRSFDDALRRTYGLTIGQLERYWGESVRRRYGWLLFFAQSAVLWAIAAAIVIALYAMRRRRNRIRLARLRAAEIPDIPAYWLDTEPEPGPQGPPAAGDSERNAGTPQ